MVIYISKSSCDFSITTEKLLQNTKIPLSYLKVSGFTDDPVPVKCDAHDGDGGHIDPQTRQDLDQSEQQ